MPADLDEALRSSPTPVRLWWRDDDAGRDHPNLARLLDMAARHRAPVALAVVPEWLEPAAAERIATSRDVTVLQHGIAHRDHASPGQRRIELGGDAVPDQLAGAIDAGRRRLAAAFDERFRSVMVPPWNRIDRDFLRRLPEWGFHGLSAWPAAAPEAAPGITRVDTHLDAIAWRPTRRCLDYQELLGLLAGLLRRGAAEPLGLLSHHLVTDDAGFDALDRLVGLVQDHPKLSFMSASDLFVDAK